MLRMIKWIRRKPLVCNPLVRRFGKRYLSTTDHTCLPHELKGSCKCGSVGYIGHGTSSFNFICHCSICRESSGRPHLAAVGFKPDQVQWINQANIVQKTPKNSKNLRFYCKNCNDYIGEDATRPLGIVALPLHSAEKQGVHASYRPNHHIFYENRVSDATDSIPKWKTLPDGTPLPHSSTPAPDVPIIPGDPQDRDSKTGRYRKDVLPLSPTRAPYSKIYHFTERDPIPNHETYIAPEKIAERVSRKYYPSPSAFVAPKKQKRDVIIIGGGHNGLVSAAYLAKAGLDVLLLERRHVLGGAAVTEELIPGFKFSRASYLAGLLRPKVIQELNLESHGFKYLPRNPSSFTPSLVDGPLKGKYLMMGDSHEETWKSIAQFSTKDADNYPRYEEFLGKVREIIVPLLDNPLPEIPLLFGQRSSWKQKAAVLKQLREILAVALKNRDVLVPFYELFTAPAQHILDRWFESEILKTTLCTDAVIGALLSPTQAGSAYVLIHHVMGEAAGKKGVWAYVEGGMGAISNAIAQSARKFGAELVTNATVKQILHEQRGSGKPKVIGVKMEDGTVLHANTILSGTTPYHTFLELLPGLSRDSGNKDEQSPLPRDFQHHIRFQEYGCGAFKINCAVNKLPDFACIPSPSDGRPGPQHIGTCHFENKMQEIEDAYREASMGVPATRPVIEMTIPSALDKTISPPGQHVVQFFVQFAPYEVDPKVGNWANDDFKNAFADRVFKIVDEFCPGFSSSVIGRDVLSPLDLERVFGLHKGNIFHGSLSLHQLAYARPAFGYSDHRTPLDGLYLCASGAHPGGGVMGAAGRNCASVVLSDRSQ